MTISGAKVSSDQVPPRREGVVVVCWGGQSSGGLLGVASSHDNVGVVRIIG